MSDEADSGSEPQDGAPAGGTPPGASPPRNRKLTIILILILVALVVAALAYWFLNRDTRPDVWDEATVPYNENACEEEDACVGYAIGAAGHGGHDPEDAIEFFYNPAIDDEIAQWGDCLGSVFTCIETGMLEASEGGAEADRAALISSCVADAECPGECKERFAQRSRGQDFDGIEALFFDMFVDERGYCVPREADQ